MVGQNSAADKRATMAFAAGPQDRADPDIWREVGPTRPESARNHFGHKSQWLPACNRCV